MNSIVIAATGRERKIIEGLQNDRINRIVEEDAAKNIDSCKFLYTTYGNDLLIYHSSVLFKLTLVYCTVRS